MSLRVRLDPDAAAELEDAAAWYESQRAGLGRAFLAAVDQTIEHVSQWPQAGSPMTGVAADLAVRQVPVPGFPYRVAYLATSVGIHVLAFAHDRRRPGYWHDRAHRRADGP